MEPAASCPQSNSRQSVPGTPQRGPAKRRVIGSFAQRRSAPTKTSGGACPPSSERRTPSGEFLSCPSRAPAGAAEASPLLAHRLGEQVADRNVKGVCQPDERAQGSVHLAFLDLGQLLSAYARHRAQASLRKSLRFAKRLHVSPNQTRFLPHMPNDFRSPHAKTPFLAGLTCSTHWSSV